MNRLKPKGFTFVELMFAVSIFAVVAIVIYSTFGSGISAWRKTQTAQNLYQDLRLALDIMVSDLENAVIFSEQEEFANFTGEKDKLSFYCLVDSLRKTPRHPELKKVTYSLRPSAQILLRRLQGFGESLQEEATSEPEEIAAGISRFNLSYCYEAPGSEEYYKWLSEWDKQLGIPQGVKIELELEAKNKLVFTQYVFIPTGNKGKEE